MSAPKKQKRSTNWNDSYSQEFGFIKRVKEDSTKVFCTICLTEFSISHGGRSDIVSHTKSKRHQDGIHVGTSSKKLTNFFKQIEASSPDLEIAAKEAAFAYHTARHNLSFKSNDCTSSLIKCIFETKFQLARTKTAAVIKNVLDPLIRGDVMTKMKKSTFLSIITDTSNHGSLKMLPLVGKLFHPAQGTKHVLLKISSIPDEKSDTITNEILKFVQHFELKDKIVCFGADNTNLNFGGKDRVGQNNVWRKIQKSLSRKVLGSGCSAHVIHNSTSAGCEMIPIDIENIVYKLHKHFKLFTTRTTHFKKICDDMNTAFAPPKSHSPTRFISLSPAVDRFIEMFIPLKDYFQSIELCPPILRDFFALKSSNFWLLFLSSLLNLVNEVILVVERADIASFEISAEIRIFKDKLKNRQKLSFFTLSARQELQKLPEEIQIQIKNNVFDLYSAMIKYLDNWYTSLDGVEIFEWMILYKVPEWSSVEKCIDFIQDRYGDHISEIMNFDRIFDEFHQMVNYIDSEKTFWGENKATAEKMWTELFTHFREDNTQLINMEKIVEFAMVIPGASVEVERIFSIINTLWTDQKNALEVSTVDAIISLQYNSDLTCCEFYKSVKGNRTLLNDVISQEKYQK